MSEYRETAAPLECDALTGYGDYVPAPGLAPVQSLTRVFLIALLLVCLARKYRRA
ncbi:MAG: hypothetical protein ACOX9R_15250 [Armatimonadota bacterium]|jgi:hypothetical protein